MPALLIFLLASLVRMQPVHDVSVCVDGRQVVGAETIPVPAVRHDYGGFVKVCSTSAFIGGKDSLRIVNEGDIAVRAVMVGTKVASSASRAVTLFFEGQEGVVRDVEGKGVLEFSVIVPPQGSVGISFGVDYNTPENYGTVVSTLSLRWGAEAAVFLTFNHTYDEKSPVVKETIDERLSNGARDVYGRRMSLKGKRWAPGLYLINRKKETVR